MLKEDLRHQKKEVEREIESFRKEETLKGKEELLNEKKIADDEIKKMKSELATKEERIAKKEETLETKMERLEEREAKNEKYREKLFRREKELEEMIANEEMKGRIIGREGRNIRAIEAATGVDLIIDDTPEAVVLSSFDGVRREVAKIALEKLISDGRIHPTKIEEVVAKAQHEVDESILDAAEQAILEVGIPTLPREVLKVFGRLKFRTSFGQNILQHSIEVAHIASALAAEIGANVDIAKRAALLHDIGKAFSHEQEGSHALNGGEFLRKFSKESEIVINAVEAHHNEVEQLSIEAVLVQAADSISASRPGARRETLSNYLKRLEQLEEIANSHEGIESSYAIQAGRELRLIVHPDNIDDDKATILARDVAKEIEEKMQYPGQIKVTVIRETRAVEYAK